MEIEKELEEEIKEVMEFNKAIGMIYKRYPNVPREKKEKLVREFFEGLERLEGIYRGGKRDEEI